MSDTCQSKSCAAKPVSKRRSPSEHLHTGFKARARRAREHTFAIPSICAAAPWHCDNSFTIANSNGDIIAGTLTPVPAVPSSHGKWHSGRPVPMPFGSTRRPRPPTPFDASSCSTGCSKQGLFLSSVFGVHDLQRSDDHAICERSQRGKREQRRG